MGPLLSTHSFWPRAPLGQGVRMSTKVTVSEVHEPGGRRHTLPEAAGAEPGGPLLPPSLPVLRPRGTPYRVWVPGLQREPTRNSGARRVPNPSPVGVSQATELWEGLGSALLELEVGGASGWSWVSLGRPFHPWRWSSPPTSHGQRRLCAEEVTTGSPSEAPEVTSGLRRKRKGKPPLAGGRGQGLPV